MFSSRRPRCCPSSREPQHRSSDLVDCRRYGGCVPRACGLACAGAGAVSALQSRYHPVNVWLERAFLAVVVGLLLGFGSAGVYATWVWAISPAKGCVL